MSINITIKAFLLRLYAYFQLTKPTIMLLVVITGGAALLTEGSLNNDPAKFFLTLVLLAMGGGSANAFNQVLEKERDSKMSRTAHRRPLPLGLITPIESWIIAILLGLGSVAGFALWFNILSALVTMATIIFYSFYYTLYLKPRTPHNIVIGGAAGAMAPVIAWAASSGTTHWIPWGMFGVIFLWTPPHFWSLAIACKDDYQKVGLPMMPLVIGPQRTWKLSRIYGLLTVVVTLALSLGDNRPVYGAVALVMGIFFIRILYNAQKRDDPQLSWKVFGFSVLYLLVIFTAWTAEIIME
ncbi:MAG: heme o synthase [bacterium]